MYYRTFVPETNSSRIAKITLPRLTNTQVHLLNRLAMSNKLKQGIVSKLLKSQQVNKTKQTIFIKTYQEIENKIVVKKLALCLEQNEMLKIKYENAN